MNSEEIVIKTLIELDIDHVLRRSSNTLWGEVYSLLQFCPVDYLESLIEYQNEYYSMNTKAVLDISLVIFHSGKPCAIWPLFLISNKNNGEFIVNNILPPIFLPETHKKTIKQLTAKCIKFLDLLSSQFGKLQLTTVDLFCGKSCISEWHQQILNRGGRVEVRYDLFVNLKMHLHDIQSNFRKSYKSLINTGRRLWNIDVINRFNELACEEFRLLHINQSGRVTRTKETWDLQWAALKAEEAFLVTLRDADYKLIGGAFFHISRDEGVYAVGAYDRALFDKPVAHIAQLVAIEEMKRRGLSWYRLGERHYSQSIHKPTEKEISISMFKQGFATDIYPRYMFDLGVTCIKK